MRDRFKLFGETAIGCEFVVSGGTPITVRTHEKYAKEFTPAMAERIKQALEKGGDKITFKRLTDEE